MHPSIMSCKNMEGTACDLIFGSPEGKSYPYTGLDRPLGIQDVQAPRISAHEGGKVVIPTQRPLSPPRDIAGTHFRWRLSLPQCHSATGMIK
jgi:hypothetical protein